MKKRMMAILVIGVMLTLLSGCANKASGVTPANIEIESQQTVTEAETESRTPVTISKPNPLTGEEDPDAYGKRPVAVMINNIKDALPQYGVEQADLIFEIPVEENLTRLMAMYSDYENMPDICSVRSCRYYFPAIADGFDAVYVHWGIDFTVYDYVDGLGMNRYDLDNEYETNVLGLSMRDQERLDADYAWEHTSVFLATKFPEILAAEGVDMNVKDDYKGTFFRFNEFEEPLVPTDEVCTKVDIDFGPQSSQFEYDEASGTYLKWHSNKPHVDAKTDKQYAYTNVIILETTIKDRDDGYHKSVNWKGGADFNGYYITQGVIQKIHWSKKDETSKLMLFDENGDELTINRGKTYIAFNYPDQAVFE